MYKENVNMQPNKKTKHNGAHRKISGTNIFFQRTKQSKDGIIHEEYWGFFGAEDNNLNRNNANIRQQWIYIHSLVHLCKGLR
jgi:hypothetical protein